MLFPNLTTVEQYNGVMLQLTNTLFHEPVWIRNRRGVKILNPRPAELNAKISATLAEAIERFGEKAVQPRSFCQKCGKKLVSMWQDCKGNEAVHCKRSQCDM